MQIRSKEFWLAAYFLAKYGETIAAATNPPKELETAKWKEAYRMFFEKLGAGRTISIFEHSLKNARDSYDSHLGDSKRIGWRDIQRSPNRLNKAATAILQNYSQINRNEIWNELKIYVNRGINDNSKIIEDLVAIDISETHRDIKSKTEGGKKVIISFRSERNPSLRNDAFKIHGFDCAVCGFNFEKTYGSWGKGFGEVHHLKLLSLMGDIKQMTNPKNDLIVVCANCHRMLHRKKNITLTIEELRFKIKKTHS